MFDETELLAEGDMEVYPLAVKAEASPVSQNESTDENPESGPTNSQITKAVFEKEKGEYKVRLVKQILWVNGMRYELQEIYEIGNSVNGGFDGNDSGKECVVCLSEPRDTTVLPCQHMLAEAAKTQFSHDYSDHLALFWAYKGWKEVERDIARYEYCWKNFLFAQTIKAIDVLRGEFYSSLKEYVLNFNARWM